MEDQVTDTHALAECFARSEVLREQLLVQAGGLLSAEEVAQRLDIQPEEVEDRRRQGRLIGMLGGDTYGYPNCQFDGLAVLSGLTSFLEAFEVREPWTQLSVLLGSMPSLGGRSALQALREGDTEKCRSVARDLGEQGG